MPEIPIIDISNIGKTKNSRMWYLKLCVDDRHCVQYGLKVAKHEVRYQEKMFFVFLDLHKDRISKELDNAFSTVGFVYLKNHGVDQQKVNTCSINHSIGSLFNKL